MDDPETTTLGIGAATIAVQPMVLAQSYYVDRWLGKCSESYVPYNNAINIPDYTTSAYFFTRAILVHNVSCHG